MIYRSHYVRVVYTYLSKSTRKKMTDMEVVTEKKKLADAVPAFDFNIVCNKTCPIDL